MKKSFYFSHDYSARSDIKIKRLIAKHGYQGYGLFWAIIEELYSNDNQLPLDYEVLGFDLNADPDLIQHVVQDFSLFKITGDSFSSDSIARRLDEIKSRSEKAKQSAKARWAKPKQSDSNADAMRTHTDSNAIKEKKRKEIKEKEINSTPTVSPIGLQHLETLAKNHGLDLNYVQLQMESAAEYYGERGQAITLAKLNSWLSNIPQSKLNPANPNKVTPPYLNRRLA